MAKKKTEELSILDEGIAKIEVAKEKATKLASEAILIKVTDEPSLAIAQQRLSFLSDLEKTIEKDRKIRKQPHLDAGKMVDDTAKAISGCLLPGTSHLRAEILNWETARRKEEAEKARIAAEADARKKELEAEEKQVAYITNVKSWLNQQVSAAETIESIDVVLGKIHGQLEPAHKMGKYAETYTTEINVFINILNAKRNELLGNIPAGTAELQQQIAESQSNLSVIQQQIAEEKALIEEVKEELAPVDTAVVSNTRTSWEFELVDITKVLPEWLIIDEKKVKEWMKENKDMLTDGSIINGIKFTEKLGLVVR